MNRINVTDFVSILDSATWDLLQDNIEEAIALMLPLAGGIMTGAVTFVSSQTFSGSGVLITDPTYQHTGVYGNLLDHISDAAVHRHEDNILWLQSTSGISQVGNVFLSGNITAEDITADNFYGDVSSCTGMPAASDSSPSPVNGFGNAGISSDFSRSDHIHKGVKSLIPGTGIGLTSAYVTGTNYYGDITVNTSGVFYVSGISGTISGNSLIFIDTSGLANYIPQPNGDFETLTYSASNGYEWLPRQRCPLVDLYINTPAVGNYQNGIIYAHCDMTLALAVITRRTAGTGGAFTIRLYNDTQAKVHGTWSIAFDSGTNVTTSATFTDADISAGDLLRLDVTSVESGAPADYHIYILGEV